MSSKKQHGLKATFRHNPHGHKTTYPQSSTILLISVGQHYHEDEKFAATIDLINRSKFKKCDIMLGDSIQRHNMFTVHDEPSEIIHKKSIVLGDEWLERNKKFYNELSMPYQIFRWDMWLKDPNYKKYRMVIDELYNNDPVVHQAFQESINEFLSRYTKQFSNFNKETACINCLEYLKEECAIIIPLWSELNYEFLIYPCNMLKAMAAIKEKLMPTSDHLYWLSLRFKRRASYQPLTISDYKE